MCLLLDFSSPKKGTPLANSGLRDQYTPPLPRRFLDKVQESEGTSQASKKIILRKQLEFFLKSFCLSLMSERRKKREKKLYSKVVEVGQLQGWQNSAFGFVTYHYNQYLSFFFSFSMISLSTKHPTLHLPDEKPQSSSAPVSPSLSILPLKSVLCPVCNINPDV